MRYVPTLCLREGMVLAKSLYGANGVLLLQNGEKLKQSHILHLAHRGFQGVYISDKLSEEIKIEAVIDDELRGSAVRSVEEVYAQVGTSDISKETADHMKKVVENIVEKILENRDTMINMINLKSYDTYTYYHSVDVGSMAVVMGAALGLKGSSLYKLGLGAMMHDIGKVFIDKDIIQKEDSLTDSEYEQVRMHPELGYRYLAASKLDFPPSALTCVLQHHERIDGSGYPRGLSGGAIKKLSRIIAIADVYDALTSDRPYRQALLPSEAMEYLMGGSGTLFDPELIFLFTRKVAAFPLGTCVLLSNGMTAIVVENYADCCLRPKVKVIIDSPEPIYLDLKNDAGLSNLTITKVVRM